MSPRSRRDSPPDGFRVVIVPPTPELSLSAAAVLLRILTRHAARSRSTGQATGAAPAGALGPAGLSVDDHPDHQQKDTGQ